VASAEVTGNGHPNPRPPQQAPDFWGDVVRGLGGRIGTLRGRPAVLDFGDPAGELRALDERAVVVPLLGRTVVEVTGKDRVDYLQRMLTQDVAAIPLGGAARAAFLTPGGRILGTLFLWRFELLMLLDFDPGAAASALPGLERYVIADDVVFEDATSLYPRALLLGPRVPDLLAELGGRPPSAPGGLVTIEPAGIQVDAFPHAFGGLASADVLLQTNDAEHTFPALVNRATRAGEHLLESARAEQGVPAYGAELDERVLPNEARLEDALSWSKGCYPGQEPVVMAKHRGRPPNLLVRLAFGAPTPPPVGAVLLADGKPVGRVTTAVPGRDGPIGLGYVRHALASARPLLTVEGGGTASIR
jgi:folate-binding protein YgfZ